MIETDTDLEANKEKHTPVSDDKRVDQETGVPQDNEQSIETKDQPSDEQPEETDALKDPSTKQLVSRSSKATESKSKKQDTEIQEEDIVHHTKSIVEKEQEVPQKQTTGSTLSMTGVTSESTTQLTASLSSETSALSLTTSLFKSPLKPSSSSATEATVSSSSTTTTTTAKTSVLPAKKKPSPQVMKDFPDVEPLDGGKASLSTNFNAPGVMSSHLSHVVSWTDLIDYFTKYKDHGIELPTGSCGRIHLVKKNTESQVDRRKYLADQVCNDPECKVTGSKVFRRSQKKKFSLTRDPNQRRLPLNPTKQLSHFIDCFSLAIREFAESERKKVGKRNVVQTTERAAFRQETIERLKSSKQWYDQSLDCSDCRLFTNLIEAGESKTLLSFSDDEIKSVLGCEHGGQAVGNNFRFLEHRVLKVYLCTNLIIASGLQDNPEEWGSMRPGSYFRKELMYDCDGQTFLPSSRRFLNNDVYMKDWEAMRQLCKDSFQFLYFTEMLRMETEGGRLFKEAVGLFLFFDIH